MKNPANRYCLLFMLLPAVWTTSLLAVKEEGTKLVRRNSKASVVLPALIEDGHWLSLKDAALGVGARVTWKATQRQVLVRSKGRELNLTVNHPFLYTSNTRRIALDQGLQWRRGRLLLSRSDLARMIYELGAGDWDLVDASGEELRASLTPTPVPDKTPLTEPEVENEPEPVVVINKGPEIHAAGRLTNGRVKVVVIDPGHGGNDGGAVGKRRTREKDICLDIAKSLRAFIQKHEPSIKVIMTRTDDRFISLKKRAQIANDAAADLFVSIHNNASRDRKASGTQVFFYDSQSSNRHAAMLAKSENSDANMLDVLLTDLKKSLVREESIQVAAGMQRELARTLQLKTRRLHYAPFFVLAQTTMPSVLVEAAFISNEREEKLLRSKAFRDQVALGIFRGIRTYRKDSKD